MSYIPPAHFTNLAIKFIKTPQRIIIKLTACAKAQYESLYSYF